MKLLFTILILITSSEFVFGQKDTIVLFFDQSWEESDPDYAHYFVVGVKNANHWERADFYNKSKKLYCTGYYEDSIFKTKTGPFNYYHENGKLKSSGRYLKNKKAGLWKEWYDNGKIHDSIYYNSDGIPYGISIAWHYSGAVSDSMILDNQGNGAKTGYHENGVIRYKGPIKQGGQQDTWTYFRANGTKSQEVVFDADSTVSFTCFEEDGSIQKKDCYYERESEFLGGDTRWRKYLSEAMSKYLPREYFNGEFEGTVYVQFIVDKDGKVTDVAIRNTTEPRLNDAALKIIKYSPKWIPAIQYNQKVKSYKIQPLVFKKAIGN